VLVGLALKYVPAWYPKHHFIPLAITGAGLTITAFGLTTSLWAGYIAMAFVGLFWIWGFNPAWAAMQNLVSDQMRGRVLAIANVAAFGVTAIGNIAAGWLGEGIEALLAGGRLGTFSAESAKQFGTHSAVAGLSAVLFIAGIVMLIWRVPEVDGLKPGDATYTPRRNIWDGITARAHRPRKTEPTSPQTPSAWEPETSHAGAK
jgi:MFS family permease